MSPAAKGFARLRARTPEEAARRRFGLWALAALIVLLPPWWMWGADLAAAALKPLAGLVLRLFGLPGGIAAGQDGGWAVETGRNLAGGGAFAYPVAAETLRRLLLGVPLFAAFMIAPPRAPRPWRAALSGAGVLALLFVLSLTAVVWGEVAPMLNPDLAPQRTLARLDGAPLHPLAAQVALIGRYLALSAAPLATAAVLWAWLNPEGRRVLLGGLEGA